MVSNQIQQITSPQLYIGNWSASLGADVYSTSSISQLVESVVLNKVLVGGVFVSPNTSTLAGTVDAGGDRVFKGSFDFDSNGALSGGVKTANFTLTFKSAGTYELSIDNAKQDVVLSDTQYTSKTSASGPIPIYNLTYTDTANGNQAVTAQVSAQNTGSSPGNLVVGTSGAAGSKISVSYVGADVNVSSDGIGVDNNVLSSSITKVGGKDVYQSEMITFNPQGDASKITMSIKGTGSVGWGTGGANDALYIKAYGKDSTDKAVEYAYYLTNIAGLSAVAGVPVKYLANGATSYDISVSDLPNFASIDKVDIITAFTDTGKGIEKTDVKVTFGFATTLTSTVDLPVVLDLTAKITDADGDSAYSNFYAGGAAAAQSGSAGADVLLGTVNAEAIYGAGGNDALTAGGGADIVVGGSGADEFKYTALSDLTNSSSSQFEKIVDFSSADGDKINFTTLLSGALLTNTINIDSADGATGHSLVNISIGGQTYVLDVTNANPNSASGSYVELDSQKLLGDSTNSTKAQWTDIVDINSSMGSYQGETTSRPTSGWTFEVTNGVAHTINTNTKVVSFSSEASVVIHTADGVDHVVDNVDKIQWHG